MPSKTRASKRKRSDEQPNEQPRTSPKPSKPPRGRQQVPVAQQPSEKVEIKSEPIESSAGRLTRHQAQALGKRPTSAQDEPERYLQQKAQKARQARAAEQRDQMERRPGSGGGARRVSAISFLQPTISHYIEPLSDLMFFILQGDGDEEDPRNA